MSIRASSAEQVAKASTGIMRRVHEEIGVPEFRSHSPRETVSPPGSAARERCPLACRLLRANRTVSRTLLLLGLSLLAISFCKRRARECCFVVTAMR
jgi:hypothetical protein